MRLKSTRPKPFKPDNQLHSLMFCTAKQLNVYWNCLNCPTKTSLQAFGESSSLQVPHELLWQLDHCDCMLALSKDWHHVPALTSRDQ